MEHKQNHYIDTDLYSMTKKIIGCNQLCTICHADETKVGKKWLRYMLSCGHIYHSKCIRKHCFNKMVIHCPTCGYLHPVYKNKYCSRCDIFGHPTNVCDINKKTIIQVNQCFSDIDLSE